MAENNPFRFVNDILQDKKYVMVTEQDEKEYNSFLTNRALSMHIDTVLYAAEVAKYPDIANKLAYDYYYHSIRKMKRKFAKWPKKGKDEDVEMVMEYYQINRSKAEEYCSVMTEKMFEHIKQQMVKGG